LPKDADPDQFIVTAELASAFVDACRGAGHNPHVERSGRFGITLNATNPTVPRPLCHLGPDRCYMLGFDDRPFERMQEDPDYIAKLIVRLQQAFESRGGDEPL
jgi:hypothetical protein